MPPCRGVARGRARPAQDGARHAPVPRQLVQSRHRPGPGPRGRPRRPVNAWRHQRGVSPAPQGALNDDRDARARAARPRDGGRVSVHGLPQSAGRRDGARLRAPARRRAVDAAGGGHPRRADAAPVAAVHRRAQGRLRGAAARAPGGDRLDAVRGLSRRAARAGTWWWTRPGTRATRAAPAGRSTRRGSRRSGCPRRRS